MPDRSPVRASQLLKQVHTKERETHNQSTILPVYRTLLSELGVDTSGYPERDRKMKTDLIFDDGVPDILRNFAYRMCVRVIPPVPIRTGSFQNGLQLVLDFFESPVMVLTEASARGVSPKTHPNRAIFRLNSPSSLAVPLSTVSLPNLARIDSAFSFITGACYRDVSRRPALRLSRCTS